MNTGQKAPITVAIHQPNFLPWLGFFYKWARSDLLVLLDDVQFIKRSIINRVKIKGPEGERWLTVPVIQKGRYFQGIDEVEVQAGWQKKVLGSIRACYGRAPYFDAYFPALAGLLQADDRLLVEVNARLLAWLAENLGITAPAMKASALTGVTGQSTERLVSICRAVAADRYLSGFGGQKYQEADSFAEGGIDLVISDFSHPHYRQLWGDFIPGLSAIDLLMSCGPQAREMLWPSPGPSTSGE